MEKLTQYVLTALICSVALGQFVQVITRYVLQVPLMGLEESIMFPTIWLYILGAVNASRENTHIRANVLEIFLKTERQHTILAIVGELISLAIGLWLLTWAWEFTTYSWRVWKESPTLYIPTFWADVALVVGLALMMAYTASHLLAHVRSLKSGSAQ
ncbi:TRAP transporter small permease subunit [Hoeflea sp. WL0058]|uniref:TRAP transporter small permease protein n=1 Tax=Flavimaribacter sediminis TaxID=2865987 RepID=A0AAE2ZII4_9HYPH|nr:TRAP transporter small permease subunit [Flavimaribacter sediminis]MBW8635596.1 TRAP transporter small permease subunit [Flavimaribacter sediminis]